MGVDLGGGSVRCVLLDAETGARTGAALPVGTFPTEGAGGLG